MAGETYLPLGHQGSLNFAQALPRLRSDRAGRFVLRPRGISGDTPLRCGAHHKRVSSPQPPRALWNEFEFAPLRMGVGKIGYGANYKVLRDHPPHRPRQPGIDVDYA